MLGDQLEGDVTIIQTNEDKEKAQAAGKAFVLDLFGLFWRIVQFYLIPKTVLPMCVP